MDVMPLRHGCDTSQMHIVYMSHLHFITTHLLSSEMVLNVGFEGSPYG